MEYEGNYGRYPSPKEIRQIRKLSRESSGELGRLSLRGIIGLLKPHRKPGINIPSIEGVRFGYTDTPLPEGWNSKEALDSYQVPRDFEPRPFEHSIESGDSLE